MAGKTTPQTGDIKRSRKGTTSRSSSTLKASVLLIIPLVILIAALARGVEAYDGEVPDWRPTATDQH